MEWAALSKNWRFGALNTQPADDLIASIQKMCPAVQPKPDPKALFRFAEQYEMQDDIHNAMKCHKTAARLGHVDSMVWLANLYMCDFNWISVEDAYYWACKAEKLGYSDMVQDILDVLELFMETTGSWEELDKRTRMDEADIWYQKGDLGSAAMLYAELVDDDYSPALYQLGRMHVGKELLDHDIRLGLRLLKRAGGTGDHMEAKHLLYEPKLIVEQGRLGMVPGTTDLHKAQLLERYQKGTLSAKRYKELPEYGYS